MDENGNKRDSKLKTPNNDTERFLPPVLYASEVSSELKISAPPSQSNTNSFQNLPEKTHFFEKVILSFLDKITVSKLILIFSFLFLVLSFLIFLNQERGLLSPKIDSLETSFKQNLNFPQVTFKEPITTSQILSKTESLGANFTRDPNKPAVDPSLYQTLTGEQFREFFGKIISKYPNVTFSEDRPSIRGNGSVDKVIWELAESRGYKLMPQAIEVSLLFVDGQRLQPEALSSWLQLKSAAAKDGIELVLVSGYRSVNDQRTIFNQALPPSVVSDQQIISREADSNINSVLRNISVPGYSRNHTGFTIDLGCGNLDSIRFGQTPCYEWMSKFNYLNAKRFGFIPSYPSGAINQGPDPEPWKYVWVGEPNLRS